ncbi:MAG: hypothetical protein AAGG75_03720 [Bacteroidota bacterium]
MENEFKITDELIFDKEVLQHIPVFYRLMKKIISPPNYHELGSRLSVSDLHRSKAYANEYTYKPLTKIAKLRLDIAKANYEEKESRKSAEVESK